MQPEEKTLHNYTVASSPKIMLYRLDGLLNTLRGSGLNLLSTWVNWKVVYNVMTILPILPPLLKAAAEVTDRG